MDQITDRQAIAEAFDELDALDTEIDELGPTATAYVYRRAALRLREQLTRRALRDLETGGAR